MMSDSICMSIIMRFVHDKAIAAKGACPRTSSQLIWAMHNLITEDFCVPLAEQMFYVPNALAVVPHYITDDEGALLVLLNSQIGIMKFKI